MKRTFGKLLSALLISVLLVPAGWAPAAAADETDSSEPVYRETFETGIGLAERSGDAELTHVTGKTFPGNEDGGALYVSNRQNEWDAADFPLEAVGLQTGRTYSVTVAVYADPDVTVPANAKYALPIVQNDNNYRLHDLFVPIEAGQTVTLTKTFTYESADRALRVQTNGEGKEVPFYIGEIVIRSEDSGEAIEIFRETFAGGQGAAEQSGGPTLTQVSGKTFAGNEDGFALHIDNRSNSWDAIDFRFGTVGLEHGKTYTVVAAVYVDPGVSVPAGAQATLNLVEHDFQQIAAANFVPGEAITLTARFTADTANYTAVRIQSNEAGKTVPFYVGDVRFLGDQPKFEPYHETFENGAGDARQSGSPTLTPVSGKAFEGNGDGGALHVSNRGNSWDGADFRFHDMGLRNGDTYQVIVKGYVDEGVSVPAGAQATLNLVEGDFRQIAAADFVAGNAFTLMATFTADTANYVSLRIQSNEAGKTVPFYIGDVFVTDKVFTPVDFENKSLGGFTGRGGVETLTVVDGVNHTPGGSRALKVENRSQSWHGPSLQVEPYVDPGHEYRVTVWAKLISPATATLQLSTQIGSGSGASFVNLASATATADGDWVKLEGTYRYFNAAGGLSVYVESSNPTASFYIDDVSFENTGAGQIFIRQDVPSLKDVYKNDFLIGTAIAADDLEGVRFELLKKHFNVVTAENAMKPDGLQPTEGDFTFAAADDLVDRALNAGLKVHGHVLVWHQQTPAWMHTDPDTGEPLSREEALDNMTTHIKTVMEHFGNKVISWDVVNEAMADNPPNPDDWRASLRQSPWYQAIGPDYVERAFLAAREVLDDHPDWDVKLYYNDYNLDNQNKARAVYNMVRELNEKYAAEHDGKLLIDGVGMQGHYSINTNPNNVKMSLERFLSLDGVEVSFTELDAMAGAGNQLSDAQAQAQAFFYAQLFKLFREHADRIPRVTLWGMDDGTSWRSANSPLLFDRNLQPKPAFFAAVDPDDFLENHNPGETEVNRASAAFGTPVIDGEVDAVWNRTATLPVTRYQTAWQGAIGTARALWDDGNLYVLVEVKDAQLDKANANPWEQDSVEIFVDENNAKTSSYEPDDGQYRVNFDNETSFNPPAIADGFESATARTADGYRVEVKIPLRTIVPAGNTSIGFDVQINDASGGQRISIANWNDLTGQGFQDPSVFGGLTLTAPASGGGSSGGGNAAPAPSEGGIEADDQGVVTVKPPVAVENGRARASVSGGLLQQALEQASPDSGGKKNVVIDLEAQPGLGAYDLELPTESLTGGETYALTIRTPLGALDIPGNLLAGLTTGTETVTISITSVDVSGLDEAVRDSIGNRPVIRLNLTAGGQEVAWNNPDAPVTVSVPYEATPEETADPDAIVVWYLDDSGGVTPVPNGRYDPASRSVVFRTAHFSVYAVSRVVKRFADLENAPWAAQAAQAMAARDVFRDGSGTSFHPLSGVGRAEFAALLVRLLELQDTGEDVEMFSDVKVTDEFYRELRIAKQHGIVNGTEGNRFEPSARITRQDMMVMAARAMKAAGKEPAGQDSLDRFPDAGDVSAYARADAGKLVADGIVVGMNGRLAPKEPLNRAQAAVVLYRIWKN